MTLPSRHSYKAVSNMKNMLWTWRRTLLSRKGGSNNATTTWRSWTWISSETEGPKFYSTSVPSGVSFSSWFSPTAIVREDAHSFWIWARTTPFRNHFHFQSYTREYAHWCGE